MKRYFAKLEDAMAVMEHFRYKEYFQKVVELGGELVDFLFQNMNESVFVIPENYIFNYLKPLITDARDRKKLLEAK